MSAFGMSEEEVRAALREAAHALAVVSVAHQQVFAGDESLVRDQAEAEVDDQADDRQVIACILEAAPGSAERPVTIKRLAELAGYAYTKHFRDAVNELVDREWLARTAGGVRKRLHPLPLLGTIGPATSAK